MCLIGLGGEGGGYSGRFWVGMCCPGLQIRTVPIFIVCSIDNVVFCETLTFGVAGNNNISLL